ncbi:MAG: hypothetical protein AB8C84_10740 [Oligoflexales bacterium]
MRTIIASMFMALVGIVISTKMVQNQGKYENEIERLHKSYHDLQLLNETKFSAVNMIHQADLFKRTTAEDFSKSFQNAKSQSIKLAGHLPLAAPVIASLQSFNAGDKGKTQLQILEKRIIEAQSTISSLENSKWTRGTKNDMISSFLFFGFLIGIFLTWMYYSFFRPAHHTANQLGSLASFTAKTANDLDDAGKEMFRGVKHHHDLLKKSLETMKSFDPPAHVPAVKAIEIDVPQGRQSMTQVDRQIEAVQEVDHELSDLQSRCNKLAEKLGEMNDHLVTVALDWNEAADPRELIVAFRGNLKQQENASRELTSLAACIAVKFHDYRRDVEEWSLAVSGYVQRLQKNLDYRNDQLNDMHKTLESESQRWSHMSHIQSTLDAMKDENTQQEKLLKGYAESLVSLRNEAGRFGISG